MIKNEFYTLRGGNKINKVGLGTWQSSNEDAYTSVKSALEVGYRHIDTAFAYENEEGVGKALKDSGIDRKELYVCTKLPSHIKDVEGTKKHCEMSLKSLGLDYLDLYLIHAPWPWSDVGTDCREGNIEAWKAMIELKKQGKIKSIGVSNFSIDDIENLITATGEIPEVNQIRFFVGNTQEKLFEYCKSKNILIEAYSPMATGAVLGRSEISVLAEKYGVSPAQICIRYCLQRGTLPLPKSVNADRIKQNIELDFVISDGDMAYLNAFDGSEFKKPYRS